MQIPPTHAAAPAPTTPERLYAEALRLSVREFTERHPCHFLVPDLSPSEGSGESTESSPRWGDAPTEVTDLCAQRPEAPFGRHVFAIRKIQPLYDTMITVGRTANHDISLRAPSVSKFHAFFKRESSGLYLVDAGSSYGTFIDGDRLPPREATLAVVGGEIGFGLVRLRLLTAALCHHAVRLAAQ